MNARENIDNVASRDELGADPKAVPELLLEQYLLGELPESQRPRVEAFIATDTGAARLAELRASNEALLAAHPPALFAGAIARSQRLARDTARPRRPGLWLALPVAAAAATLLVWAVTRPTLPSSDQDAPAAQSAPADPAAHGAMAKHIEEPGETRIKGLAPYLLLHKRDGQGQAVRLKDGAAARSNDVVQISYVAASKPHGVVLSIDGRGMVTLHFPEAPNASTALEPQGQTTLAHAYELDDAPAFERFIFITATHPIPVDNVLGAAKTLAAQGDASRKPLLLPADMDQVSFTLRKER